MICAILSAVLILIGNGSFTCDVVEVIDGDTFKATLNAQRVTIRIARIDAPEIGQPYGDSAAIFTGRKLLGKRVDVRRWSWDKYGRIVGDVFTSQRKRFADEIVAAGLAWHYRAYSSDENLQSLENKARAARVGLWRDSQPVAPWAYRQGRRGANDAERLKNMRYIDSLFKARPNLGRIIEY